MSLQYEPSLLPRSASSPNDRAPLHLEWERASESKDKRERGRARYQNLLQGDFSKTIVFAPRALNEATMHSLPTLDAEYVHAVPWSEFPIVTSTLAARRTDPLWHVAGGGVRRDSLRHLAARALRHGALLPRGMPPLGLSRRLGGDDLSELSANYQPPADKIDTDNSPVSSSTRASLALHLSGLQGSLIQLPHSSRRALPPVSCSPSYPSPVSAIPSAWCSSHVPIRPELLDYYRLTFILQSTFIFSGYFPGFIGIFPVSSSVNVGFESTASKTRCAGQVGQTRHAQGQMTVLLLLYYSQA